jgi:hypothetical protein
MEKIRPLLVITPSTRSIRPSIPNGLSSVARMWKNFHQAPQEGAARRQQEEEKEQCDKKSTCEILGARKDYCYEI